MVIERDGDDSAGPSMIATRDEGVDASERDADSPDAASRSGDARRTRGTASTQWVTENSALPLWRGAVDAPDRLRVETRDGRLLELRLERGTTHRLGRTSRVAGETNDLVCADVASRLAARLRHDGVRWWIQRRAECSVPLQIGPKEIARGESEPLVHGASVTVGGMRATFVDRRYVTPMVAPGVVDEATGLLSRLGVEHELVTARKRKQPVTLVLVKMTLGAENTIEKSGYSQSATIAVALHEAFGGSVVGHTDETAVLVVVGDRAATESCTQSAAALVGRCTLSPTLVVPWEIPADAADLGQELAMALRATRLQSERGSRGVHDLRAASGKFHAATAGDLVAAHADPKRATVLFAIEAQQAIAAVGEPSLERLVVELAESIGAKAGQGAIVVPLAPGTVAACVLKKLDVATFALDVHRDWLSRPPVTDGRMELPRELSWEQVHDVDPLARAFQVSRECQDPHGVLAALARDLPYPIAGRVLAATSARTAIERVKCLFDVLEGTWRFIATVLLASYFAARRHGDVVPEAWEAMIEFRRRHKTRDGLPLGAWREVARIAARALKDGSDPLGAAAADVLGVKLAPNQTFDTLSSLLHAERNGFAHGHYTETRAAIDVAEFEQMTRTLLRSLKPLTEFRLVTVERAEPDLYGDQQTVEYVDHTGPFPAGMRHRIGLNSPARLASVVYLAKFREGLVLPLDPFVRRAPLFQQLDLYWLDHLPNEGICLLSACVGAASTKAALDSKRFSPLLREFIVSG